MTSNSVTFARWTPARWGLWILCVLLACGCGEEPLSQLLVRVRDRNVDHRASIEYGVTFLTSPGVPEETVRKSEVEPFSFGVVPYRGQHDRPARIRVGVVGEAERFSTEAEVPFVPGQTVLVDVYLDGVCANVECRAGTTCSLCGECIDIERPGEIVASPGAVRLDEPLSDCDASQVGGADAGLVADNGDPVGEEAGVSLSATPPPLAMASADAGTSDAGGADAGSSNAPSCLGPCSCVVDYSVGLEHACAVTDAGEAWCWGYNRMGQIALDGLGQNLLVPRRVAADAAQIAAGDRHSCLLTRDGRVECWGSNAAGQLGTGGPDGPHTRAPVDGDLGQGGARALHCGDGGCCAKDAENQLYCWGGLGSGNVAASGSSVPVLVDPVDGESFESFGRGEKMSVVNSAGDSFRLFYQTPSFIASATREVALTRSHQCMVDTSTRLSCWGSEFMGNARGQLGRGQGHPSPVGVPVYIGFPSGWQTVAATEQGNCAIHAGELFCWGDNREGQLFLPLREEPYWEPEATQLGNGWVDVQVGEDMSCAMNAVGDLYCIGNGQTGQSPICLP